MVSLHLILIPALCSYVKINEANNMQIFTKTKFQKCSPFKRWFCHLNKWQLFIIVFKYASFDFRLTHTHTQIKKKNETKFFYGISPFVQSIRAFIAYQTCPKTKKTKKNIWIKMRESKKIYILMLKYYVYAVIALWTKPNHFTLTCASLQCIFY